MERRIIEKNAHQLLKLMNNKSEWTYEELKQLTGLADRELNSAIGWLAREEQITFFNSCGKSYYSCHVNVFIG